MSPFCPGSLFVAPICGDTPALYRTVLCVRPKLQYCTRSVQAFFVFVVNGLPSASHTLAEFDLFPPGVGAHQKPPAKVALKKKKERKDRT